MKRQDGYEKMLYDVLFDEDLKSFREALLNESRVGLRDQRRRAALRWIVPVAAAALLLIVFRTFFLIPIPESPSSPDESGLIAGAKSSFYLDATVPLTDMFIESIPIEDNEWLCQVDMPIDFMIEPEPQAAFLVESSALPDFRITDSEMLALFAGVPCGLVDTMDQGKRLIFVNREDERRIVARLD